MRIAVALPVVHGDPKLVLPIMLTQGEYAIALQLGHATTHFTLQQ